MILWHIDPFLGRDLEADNRMAAIAVQRCGKHGPTTIELCDDHEMGGYIRLISGQQLSNYVHVVIVIHAVGETVCYLCSLPRGVKEKIVASS
jgi:hypothetical protein